MSGRIPIGRAVAMVAGVTALGYGIMAGTRFALYPFARLARFPSARTLALCFLYLYRS